MSDCDVSKLEFENAHCHTYYSNTQTLPDSTTPIEDYAQVYNDRGMHCLCMSEHGYRGDVWLQADVAAKYGMKPICAAETYFVPDRNPELKDGRNFHLLLLAKNNAGFRELNRALSEGQLTGFYRYGRLDFDILSRLNYKNFICTTACIAGVLRNEQGERLACELAEIFRENFRLEVQYHNNELQAEHNAKVIEMYRKYGWPLFFGTDSHYINSTDAILRKELQLSANIDLEERSDVDWDLYLPTAEEAYDFFVKQGVLSRAQIEEAFENTLELREFEGFSYTTERKLPISVLRRGMTQEERNKLYVKLVWDGYRAKAGEPTPSEASAIQQEIDTIINTNSADYFISLKDMLDRGVELGGVLTQTARGSAGSFVSNYALGFTTINRLRAPVEMYPERFISADKLLVSNPDIDSNLTNVEAFEQAGKEMFGEWGCVPMIAYSKAKTSAAFKLLARARNLDFETANEVSKQIKAYELARKHAIENNSDDPDYDVDDDIKIEDYVSFEYIDLINDSKKYQGIITGITPHPCGHITYHSDLREDIGIVRVKARTGNKEPKFCAYIDGATADKINYVKSDLLRVDVVKVIDETFKRVHQPVMPVDELLAKIKNNQDVWDLYAKGYTQGLNQCEREASTKKCMEFKPKNIVELASFIASIRPGFKSMGPTFWSRTPFQYGIQSLDDLLKMHGLTGPIRDSSFLIYDEQLLKLLIAGDIPPAEAYAVLKAIKKKKQDKVLKAKDKFKTGFTKMLVEKENASEELAHATVERVWKIIEDSGSYLFCCSHSYAMANDSAYNAYLKCNYPYEYYAVMLQLYTEKVNKPKIAAIISEMKRYKGIELTAGQFGEDNRDWYINKENKTISQSLASLKFMSQQAAEDLYKISDRKFDTFTDVLRCLQMDTCLTTRQITILIYVNYFRQFGHRQKLLNIMDEFFNGTQMKAKLTKTVKSYEKRLATMREFESKLQDEEMPIEEIVRLEYDIIGLCLSKEPSYDRDKYYVEECDDKYGVNLKLYSIQRGTHGIMRMRKGTYTEGSIKAGNIIRIKEWKRMQRCRYNNGKRTPINGEFDMWIQRWEVA